MCGIAGYIGPFSNQEAHSLAHEMAQSLIHRGPDHQDTYVEALGNDTYLGLAHSLLAIIGKPGEGIQPFKVPGGILVFNGAIYNFAELRDELKKSGRTFKTETDTEVLAHGLALHGIPFLNRVRGMFAFGFWNTETKTLWLGRDPFGVKPLYYAQTSRGFLFASEYKAMLPHLKDLEIDEAALYDFLRLRYIPGEATLFRGIRKAAPGSIIEINKKGQVSKTVSYFDWTPSTTPPDQERLFELLNQAITRRSVANVEVAALLSGGVDSSLVCDLLERRVKSLHTYTLSFPGLPIDESSQAKAISATIGAVNTSIPDLPVGIDTLEKLAYHLDDPYGDPIILALDRIFSFIKGKQRVLVTGEGADELFSGYVHHRIMGALNPIPSAAFSLGRKLLPMIPFSTLAKVFPYAGKLSAQDYEAAVRRFTSFVEAPSLFSFQSIFFLFGSEDFYQANKSYMRSISTEASFENLRNWDLHQWLPNSQLFKLDKIAMASSIEAREPFVDQDLVLGVLGLRSHRHFNFQKDKPMMRAAIAHKTRLPDSVVAGKKASFFRPFTDDRNARLRSLLKERIYSHRSFLEGYLRSSSLNAILNQTDNGLLSQKKPFALGMLALWKEMVWSLQGTSKTFSGAIKNAA